ncbi:MAG: DUF975 family protein [Treponema sp.]|nr:DUF975 family protein [Treponema sp.]MCL2272381.1 DUF975 family protein [Treponema sp.]
MSSNKELRALSRSQLKGSWLIAVGVFLIYFILIGASGMVVIGPLILGGPLFLGLVIFLLNKVRGGPAAIENLFDGFQRFVPALILYLLQTIYIFLWSLLLIVPGIIKCLGYSMAFFILRDNPEINAMDALKQSIAMMKGYKWKLFCLCLSFIGWMILCVFTFGIGLLWLCPYVYLSLANFYEDLKKNQ